MLRIHEKRNILVGTSCPKASNGQRFPCPASLYWPRTSFGKQGSGPNRGRSPVEWGDFPYVRPSVCLYVQPARPQGQSARFLIQLARPQVQPARWMDGQTDRRADEQTYGHTVAWNFSPFYRTTSPIAALFPKRRSRPIKRSRARESLTI